MKSYTLKRREQGDECTNTSFKSGLWFDSSPLGPLVFFFFFFFFLHLLHFQLFNECLHSACYCLKLSSKRQISSHSTKHYGANALRPQFLSILAFSDSCRVHVRPICATLEVMCFCLLPVFNIWFSVRVMCSCVPTPTPLPFMFFMSMLFLFLLSSCKKLFYSVSPAGLYLVLVFFLQPLEMSKKRRRQDVEIHVVWWTDVASNDE